MQGGHMAKKINAGDNIVAPMLELNHHELTPASEVPNKLASKCPACNYGTLGCNRDHETLILIDFDACLFCGQRVRYLDIEDLRRKDWAGAQPC